MLGNPFTDPNWAANLADAVERVVGKIRSVTTDNAVKASRAIVFGLLGCITVLVATPLITIAWVRFCQVVLSRMTRTDHDTTVWLSYMVTGALMFVAGFVVLRLRHVRREDGAA